MNYLNIMRIITKIGGIGLFVLWFSTVLHGQNYPFSTFTNQDGLPGMQVMRLFQDSRKLLWLTTKTGLAYFDGSRFHTLSSKEFPDINPFRLGGFAETRDQAIWFANDQQVFRFDGQHLEPYSLPANWQVERYDPIYTNRHDQVIVVAQNSANLNQKTLFCLEKGKKPRQIRLPPLPTTGYFTPKWFDAENDTWYGCIRRLDTKERPIVYWHQGKWHALPDGFSINEQFRFYLKTPCGKSFIQTKNQTSETVYYEVQGAGKLKEYARGKGEKFKLNYPIASSIPLEFANRIYFIPANQTTGTEIVLNHQQLHDVVASQEGNGYFVATEKGLRHIFDNGFRNFDESQAPYVWTVVEGKEKDEAWFGNFQGGLLHWTPGKSPILEKNIPLAPIQSKHPEVNSPHLLQFYYGGFRERGGDAWFPESHGLLHFNGTNKEFEFINSIGSFVIADEPEQDLVWQGTHEGIFATHKTTKELIFNLRSGIEIPNIRYYMVIFKDSKGRYWFGGKGGMLRFDSFQAIQKLKFTHLKPGTASLPRIGFAQLLEDSYGTIWGASGDGLYWLDEANMEFKAVTHAQLESPVNSILSSDKNTLWIGTNDALLKMDLAQWYQEKRVQMLVFNHHTGFLGQEVAQAGLYLDSRRRLWVPSGSILSFLDLKHVHKEITPTQPYILRLGKRRLPHIRGGLDQTFEENHLLMEVGATGYYRPLRAQFSYRVDDEPWSDWTEQTQIYLPTLTNGRHTVEVRSQTLGWEGDEPLVAKQVVIIQAPVWESPNFAKYLTLILIALSVIGGIGYIRHLQIRTAWMEAQQKFLHLQLGSLQELLTPHFIYNTLESIGRLIRKGKPMEASQQIYGLSHILRSYVTVGVGKEKDCFTVREKVKILEDYLRLLLAPMDEPFSYEIQISPEVPLDLPLIPPLMIQPFVENAINHGLLPLETPGHLRIQFLMDSEGVHCVVEDNGQGRAAATTRKSKDSLSVSTQLIEERIQILHRMGRIIRIRTEDVEPTGTRIHLHFTIANSK